jgi:sigma-B regulation protein RsbU (phosphoserine phosphatase)
LERPGEKTILLIDDDPDIRELTSRLLTPRGYSVTEAKNGADGIQKVTAKDFALILLDYNMPVMDGVRFLRALRNDLMKDIPVLMMSGSSDPEIRKECYALGVFDFIEKPESAEVLLARVENGMKIAELQRYHREIKTEMRVSAAILKDLTTPDEIRHEHFSLRTFSESFLEVGGDISLVYGAESDNPVFMIADITGHGISAALFAIFVGVTTRHAFAKTHQPEKILARLNRELAEHLPKNFFVTMFCCCYDVKKGELHYVNAGHPPPFVFSQDKARQLEIPTSPVLGVKAEEQFVTRSIPFGPGDWLLMYTDGVLDVVKGENYEPDQAVALIAADTRDATEVFSRVTSHLRGQTGVIDDRTVMLLQPR